MSQEAGTLERAEKFFSKLAAGVPLSNLTWGKSKREITDFYHLAARLLRERAEGRLAYIPFKTGGILTASTGVTTLKGKSRDTGEEIEATGKICIFECTEEEARRHDEAADRFIERVCVGDETNNGGGNH